MFSNITFIYKCKVSMYIYRSIMYFLDIKILSLAQINNLIIFHWKKNVLIYILFLYFLWNDESICFWWIMSLLRDCWTSNYNLLFWVDKTVTVYKHLLLQLFTFLSKSDYRQAWIINCMIILLKKFWHNLSFHCIFRGILINDL